MCRAHLGSPRPTRGLKNDLMRHSIARTGLLQSLIQRSVSCQHTVVPFSRHQFLVAATTSTTTSSSSSGSKQSRKALSHNESQKAPDSASVAPEQSLDAAAQPLGGKSLMIVESPTKATKIQKFLGDGYQVLASYGHVRDLLNKAGAVDPENDFKLVWAISGAAGESRLQEIAAAASGCRAVLLATDPDREGEAISWHLTQELQRRGVLHRGQTLQRVTFNEVTQKAVRDALQHPRQVSDDLVDAYLARRALDYLLGFGLSPLLWRRLGPAARSAGRVQSVALRLVCEREDAVQLFVPDEYWTIEAGFALDSDSSAAAGALPAKLVEVDGQKLSQLAVKTQQQAHELVQRLWQQQQQLLSSSMQPQEQLPQPAQEPVWYTVRSLVKRPVKRNPPPPLVTSTLQQEAARRLGFSASKTMQVAQQLYEGTNAGEGLITYMRTDGVSLSAEAADSLRDTIGSVYGADHLPAGGPRVYKSRAKNAQEAHEAIRPTNPALTPGAISGLTQDQANLYSLVWRRAMASQMESAEMQQVSAEFVSPCGTLLLRCTGSSLVSPGWLAAWSDWDRRAAAAGADTDADTDAGEAAAAAGVSSTSTDEDDDIAAAGGSSKAALSQILQQLQEGQQVLLARVLPGQHFTKPPARYSEASMIKTLEEVGVGRPSTYAPIIRKLLERGYVVKSGRTLIPTPLGRLLTAYLTIHFTEYVDVNFTAKVEEQLDEVSAGALAWKELMRDFWVPLDQAMAAAKAVSTSKVFQQLEQRLDNLIFMPRRLPAGTASGAAAADADSSKALISPTETAAAVPGGSAAVPDPRRCPVCGGQLVLKPSRAVGGFIGCSNYESQGCTFGRPLWPDLEEAASLSDEEEAVAAAAAGGAVLGSSKLLGRQPGTEVPVLLKRGPFGLYVQLGEDTPLFTPDGATSSSSSGSAKAAGSKGRSKVTTATLPRTLNWSNTTLEDALQLLALPRTLGTHPEDGEAVLANNGRFGPYVVHRTLYATLPKGMTPEEVTFDHAVDLLTAKAARMRARGKDPYAEKPKKGKKATGSKSSSKAGKAANSSSSSSRAGRISGYNLFSREIRPSFAAAGASSSGGSILSQIAAAWRALPEGEKADFNDRARQANEAAAAAADSGSSAAAGGSPRQEVTAFDGLGGGSGPSRAGGSRRRLSTSTAAANSNSNRRSNTRSGSGRTTTSSSSSSNGDESRQDSSSAALSSSRRRSRGLSGYQLFCQQQTELLLKANPGMAPQEVFAKLGAHWKQLSEQQRAAYGSSAGGDPGTQAAAPDGEPSSSGNSNGSSGGGNSSPESAAAKPIRSHTRTRSSNTNSGSSSRTPLAAR